MTDWNEHVFFSGITEDYSNYRWYKGESENPYQNDQKRPLAASFWEYERGFHLAYLDKAGSSQDLAEAYKIWKLSLITEHLPGNIDWEKVFETGTK